jgi:hypothetical protein
MTRTGVEWAIDHKANDLGNNTPTSPRARADTRTPFDARRHEDDDDGADFFDAEAGWYVPASILTRPNIL